MEEYNDQEIEEIVTSSPTFSSIEAYAFGFMTGFVHKNNVKVLEKNIISKLDANQIFPSSQKFRWFAELLYDLGHIQDPDIDILTIYFQQIESKIESEFDLLSKVQLFYFGRFHSLYIEADVITQMNQANTQNRVRRNMNKYDSEAKILREIKSNLDKEVNNKPPPPFENLKKLNVPKPSSQVKMEPKNEEIQMTTKQEYLIQSETSPSINMEIEMPEAVPPQSLPQAFQQKRIAKKSGKNPSPKPEPKSAFTTSSMIGETNSFSLNLLAETFKLNAQMQSQYNTNQNNQSFYQVEMENTIQIAPPAVIDLEEIIPEKTSFDHFVDTSSKQALPNHSTIDSDIQKEPKNNKLNSTDKTTNVSEISSPQYPRIGGGARKSVPLNKTRFEEEEKSSQIIFNPVNPDDIYDISYCSSDNVSFVSNPKLPDEQDPRELVLSYKSENEPCEEGELSFDGNINVFCK